MYASSGIHPNQRRSSLDSGSPLQQNLTLRMLRGSSGGMWSCLQRSSHVRRRMHVSLQLLWGPDSPETSFPAQAAKASSHAWSPGCVVTVFAFVAGMHVKLLKSTDLTTCVMTVADLTA